MWEGGGWHTLVARRCIAHEGPPNPAARPGPVQRTGRAVCSKAHALTGYSKLWILRLFFGAICEQETYVKTTNRCAIALVPLAEQSARAG